MKQKVLAFDIDGVICNTLGSDYKNSKPNKEAIEKINNLYDKGNKIIIFTARFMGRTNNNYQEAYKLGYKFTLNQLQSWNLKFNELSSSLLFINFRFLILSIPNPPTLKTNFSFSPNCKTLLLYSSEATKCI